LADSTRIVFNSDGSTTRFINNKKDTTFKGRWNAPSMTKADSDAQKRRLAYAKNVSSPKARQQQSVIGETFAVTRPTDEGGTITVTRGGKVTVRDSERKVVERFQGDDSSVKDFLVRQKKSSKRVKDEEAEKQQLKRLLKSVIVTPKGKSEASARLKVLDAPVFLRDVKKLRGFQIEKTIKDYNKGVVKRGVLEPVKKLRELQLSAIEERERQPKFTSLESLNEYILGKKGEEKFARKLKLDVVARNIRIASRTPISDVVGKGVERKVLGAVLPFISKDKVDKVASTLGKFRDKTKAVIGVAVAETVERPLQDLELYKAGKFLKKSIGFAGEVVEKIGERFPKVGKVLKFTGKGASVSIASAYAGGVIGESIIELQTTGEFTKSIARALREISLMSLGALDGKVSKTEITKLKKMKVDAKKIITRETKFLYKGKELKTLKGAEFKAGVQALKESIYSKPELRKIADRYVKIAETKRLKAKQLRSAQTRQFSQPKTLERYDVNDIGVIAKSKVDVRFRPKSRDITFDVSVRTSTKPKKVIGIKVSPDYKPLNLEKVAKFDLSTPKFKEPIADKLARIRELHKRLTYIPKVAETKIIKKPVPDYKLLSEKELFELLKKGNQKLVSEQQLIYEFKKPSIEVVEELKIKNIPSSEKIVKVKRSVSVKGPTKIIPLSFKKISSRDEALIKIGSDVKQSMANLLRVNQFSKQDLRQFQRVRVDTVQRVEVGQLQDQFIDQSQKQDLRQKQDQIQDQVQKFKTEFKTKKVIIGSFPKFKFKVQKFKGFKFLKPKPRVLKFSRTIVRPKKITEELRLFSGVELR